VTHAVTLRDMFAHRSGLPDHAGDPLEDLGYDRAGILHRLRYQKPGSGFRAHYDYTNFGFTAASVAAAAASGRSWEDLCAARLYSRLGMARTSSRFADFAAASNRVHSHVRENGAWVAKYTREPDAQAPAGGVTSSMRDVAAWLCLQLGQGTVEGQEIVQAAALAETHRPQIVSNRTKDPAVDRDGFYGLGWNVNYDERDGIRWSHSGAFNLGAATCVEVLPNQKLAIGVLSNAQPIGVPEAIIQSFVDVVMTGQVQRDWISFLGDIFKRLMAPDYGTATDYANPPPQATPPLAPRTYAGAYENDLFGRIVVAPTAQGMELRLGPKPLSFPLCHFDRDTFLYQPVGEGAFGPSSVIFQIGADGKPVSVTIENLNLNGQGTFAFAPAKG
jgi:CubicO group peptidase (beta-lactamase class C family)